MHPIELTARDWQVAGHARAGREHDRLEALAQLLHVDVTPDVHAAAQLDALVEQLAHAALDHGLLDLEVRHPEAHQAARGLVALEQRHPVTCAA